VPYGIPYRAKEKQPTLINAAKTGNIPLAATPR
jgi:hypothetical protein